MSDLTFLHTFIKSELEDIVGSENVSIRSSDILVYGVDYFYGSKMWEDRGKRLPTPDIIVNPGTAEEISKKGLSLPLNSYMQDMQRVYAETK